MRTSSRFVVTALLAGFVTFIGGAAHAQYASIQNSPDTVPAGSNLANLNLKTLLNSVGIGSHIYADPALNGGFATDQILGGAFTAIAGQTPQIEVLFTGTFGKVSGLDVRKASAGYQAYHRMGWYQRAAGAVAPLESQVKDVVWEQEAYVNGATTGSSKLTSTVADFANLNRANNFELRLTSATASDARSGSIYSNAGFNSDTFNNVIYVKERDLSGNVIANSYIVAWEDLRGSGDRDYNDMAVRIKYVTAGTPNATPTTIPEPATALLALPVLGLALRRRRK